MLTATLEAAGERRLSGVLIGSRDEGRPTSRLTRLDSTTTLPVRDMLENRWASFPLYDALSDSIQEDGGKLERGPLRWRSDPAGRSPTKAILRRAVGRSDPGLGERGGARSPRRGTDLREAWSNLLGTTVPAPPGSLKPDGWMKRVAGCCMLIRAHAGDWSEFGRAWSSLRNLLGLPLDSASF